ncbi:hypothetical protein ABL78_0833 [Leptomonas seymouri]|uniref:Uncharacterized protein n=1 Tax=Leptomonas seymouri TaxID=5684 RepID=A0A0N1PFD0_LEPSE|nr:hypothetical protein ABL78_0833 [Leptomonas seymouri]|eukprot:KPI90080.1 hypothetical protein ABL78_0833 [Leptomonas seymouri]
MYPRGRGKGTPLGSSNTEPEAPSFNESALSSTNVNSTESANASAPASPSSPPSHQQQSHPQQNVRPRRSLKLPYSSSGYPTTHTGNLTINLSGNRADGNLYPQASPHQQLQPPPPQPAIPGGVSGGSGPCRGSNANTPSISTNFIPRGAAPAYDAAALPPPPPPPPPPQPVVYEGDAISFHDAVESAPSSPLFFSASGGPHGSHPSFSNHSRTSSIQNHVMSGMPAACERSKSNTTGEFRPPPTYGDVPYCGAVAAPLNAHANINTNNNNNSISSGSSVLCRVALPTAGQGISSNSNTSESVHLPPYVPAVPTGGAGLPPHSASVPGSSSRQYDGSSSGSHASLNPAAAATGGAASAAAAASRLPRGPVGLKITVGGSAGAMLNPTPVSPLLNSPLQGPVPSSQGESNKNPRRPRIEHRTPTKSTNANSNGDNIDPSANRGNAEPDAEVSTGASKPTVEEAEARYQHLYEEFRKMSGVRTKLAEDAERLKRELAAATEEMQYYREKTLTTAEEREAIVQDYNADVQYLLRLVDALASDVLTAHWLCKNEATTEKLSDAVVPSTPQHAIDIAASRLATLLPRHSTVATQGDSSTNGTKYMNATLDTMSLSEHLGLQHSMWMSWQPTTTSDMLVEDEQHTAGRNAHARGHTTTSALTPAQQQSLLLRDELRDVQRKTHAAMSSYMASLDYGAAPVAVPRGYATGSRSVHGASNESSSQRQFNSEYRGLHLHVEVPCLHAHSVANALPGQDKEGLGSVNSSPGKPCMTQRYRLNPGAP